MSKASAPTIANIPVEAKAIRNNFNAPVVVPVTTP